MTDTKRNGSYKTNNKVQTNHANPFDFLKIGGLILNTYVLVFQVE